MKLHFLSSNQYLLEFTQEENEFLKVLSSRFECPIYIFSMNNKYEAKFQILNSNFILA